LVGTVIYNYWWSAD